MSDNIDVKQLLEQLPNSVSGDGKTFVSILKKAMKYFATNVSAGIDQAISNSTDMANVNAITLSQSTNVNSDGYPRIDVECAWKTDNIENYAGADIYTRVGTYGSFQLNGSTDSTAYTIQSLSSGTTLFVKVLSKNTTGKTADYNLAPMASIDIIGSVNIPTAPTQFTVTWTDGLPYWQWTSVNEQDYFDYYELREDTNVGKYEGLLDATSTLSSTVEPSQRAGTVYLYVRNIFGNYSYPIAKQFNKAVPQQPTAAILEPLLLGLKVTTDLIPLNCIGVEIDFLNTESQEEQVYRSTNRYFTFYAGTGTWAVKYRFYDKEGVGEWSNVASTTINSQIVESQIANNAVTEAKIIDNAITVNKINANAITADKITAGAITTDKLDANAVTTEKLNANAVTADKILAGAIVAEKIGANAVNAENINASAVTTDKLDANAVTAEKVSAGAIDATKLNVQQLSAITGTIGTLKTADSGARVVIQDNLISVYDANGRLRVRLGVW